MLGNGLALLGPKFSPLIETRPKGSLGQPSPRPSTYKRQYGLDTEGKSDISQS